MGHPGMSKLWRWWMLGLALLLGCASGPPRAPEVLALRAGTYASPSGSGPSTPDLKAPLTIERLVRLAQARGIGVVGAPVTRNREMGRAFQGAVLRSIKVPENTTLFPAPGRGGPRTAVIPDGVVTAGRRHLVGGISFNPSGAFVEVVGSECLDFMEVKARSCRLTLSSAQRQLQGFIDALNRLRPRGSGLLGAQPPRPALLLVTTADMEVGEDVSLEAGRYGVAVFQAVAWEEEGLITVGSFEQRTGFADVPPRFQFPSKPEALK